MHKSEQRTGVLFAHLAILVGLAWAVVGVAKLIMSEQPTASLSGLVISSVTGKPIPKATVTLRPADTTGVIVNRVFNARCDKHGEFSFRIIPAGLYEIEAHSPAHSLSPTHLKLREGAKERVTLELLPKEPWLHLILPQRTFTTSERVRIRVRGFVLEDKLTLKVHKVDVQRLLSSGGVEIPQQTSSEWGIEQIFAPETPSNFDSSWWRERNEALRRFIEVYGKSMLMKDVPVSGRDGEGIFTQYVDVPVKLPGVYFVELSAGGRRVYTSIIVVDIGVVVKYGGQRTLIYACKLDSGTPVAGAVVFVSERMRNGLKELGVTGEDGVAVVDTNKIPRDTDVTFVVSYNGQTCFARLYTGMNPNQKYRVHIYTDRPVYRPGDTVHFKGIVRLQGDKGYVVPDETNVEFELRDRGGRRVWTGSGRTNPYGTFHGSLNLPHEIATGSATIAAIIDGEQHERTIQIAAYRKPEFAIKVSAERTDYLPTEVVRISVEAHYYFGVPVRNAKVHYRVFQVELPCDGLIEGEGVGEDVEWYEWSYGTEIVSGKAVTDENGRARINFKMPYPEEFIHAARDSSRDKLHIVTPPVYSQSVWVSVTDAGGREVEQWLSLKLHPASLSVSIEPQRYLASPDEKVAVKIKVSGLDGKPVGGVKVKAIFGKVFWEWDTHEFRVYLKPSVSTTLTTSQSGVANWVVKPTDVGEWAVYAIVEDDIGWWNADAEYICAYEDGLPLPEVERQPKLEFVSEKRSFSVGERARAMLRSSIRDAYALITIEAEKVYSHWLVKLDGNAKLLEFDVQPSYIPGVWLCAALVRSKELSEAKAFIEVSKAARELKVSVQPSKQRCSPGEVVEYLIKVTDKNGKPVRAELSLSVVDEAIYAIKDEPLDELLRAFYGRKQHEVVTVSSFPELYLQANKVGVESVRKHFPDTAFWAPSLYTDEKGIVRINVKMPDAITTWRATVKAVSMDTSLGVALDRLIVSKPLMVRLQLPRFLTEGDEVDVVGLVHNESDGKKELMVRLSCDGLNVDGDSVRKVKVGPRDAAKLVWRAKATKYGYATLTLSAKSSDGCGDAVQKRLQILPLAIPYKFTKSGRLNGGEAERITLHIPSDALKDVGEVEVLLSSSPAGSVLSAIEFLISYPYGCVEQTMSSFMPDVLAYRAWKELGWAFPTSLEKELPKMVGHGLARLYRYQHEDGSWGWCYYDDADLWMTAYVAYGLLECRDAGFEVDNVALERAGYWLKEHLPSAMHSHSHDYACALACYVLAKLGERKGIVPQAHWIKRASPKAVALIAMTAHRVGDNAAFNVAMRQLYKGVIEGVEECTWGTVEDTAWALRALLNAEDVSDINERHRVRELADKAANYLLSIRTGECWESTKQTAVVVAALVDYLKKRRWTPPRGTFTAALNGKKRSIKIDPKHAYHEDLTLRISINEAIEGDNQLTLQFDGSGTLYYATMLNCMRRIGAQTRYIASSGITVTRCYELITYGSDGKEYSRELADRLKCSQGSILKCTLTVNTSKPLRYLLIEEPLPAGCEVIERGELERYEWDLWYAEQDIRDDKIVFFVREMPRGTKKISYRLRVECSGNFTILPTTVSAMYEPTIMSRGSPQLISVR
ncbi:MAG: MG2 domain-containing protein [Armatimonadetes bacterium]|nr:MG2 domain-containing protein [Armatimonadota bacterium]